MRQPKLAHQNTNSVLALKLKAMNNHSHSFGICILTNFYNGSMVKRRENIPLIVQTIYLLSLRAKFSISHF